MQIESKCKKCGAQLHIIKPVETTIICKACLKRRVRVKSTDREPDLGLLFKGV